MNYVGIDHHRQYSHITWLDEKREVVKLGRVTNRRRERERREKKRKEAQKKGLASHHHGRISLFALPVEQASL